MAGLETDLGVLRRQMVLEVPKGMLEDRKWQQRPRRHSDIFHPLSPRLREVHANPRPALRMLGLGGGDRRESDILSQVNGHVQVGTGGTWSVRADHTAGLGDRAGSAGTPPPAWHCLTGQALPTCGRLKVK